MKKINKIGFWVRYFFFLINCIFLSGIFSRYLTILEKCSGVEFCVNCLFLYCFSCFPVLLFCYWLKWKDVKSFSLVKKNSELGIISAFAFFLTFAFLLGFSLWIFLDSRLAFGISWSLSYILGIVFGIRLEFDLDK